MMIENRGGGGGGGGGGGASSGLYSFAETPPIAPGVGSPLFSPGNQASPPPASGGARGGMASVSAVAAAAMTGGGAMDRGTTPPSQQQQQQRGGVSSSEGGGGGANGSPAGQGFSRANVPRVTRFQACEYAASLVSSTARGELDRQSDLADRLNEAPLYSYQRRGWPPVFSVASEAQLPAEVVQRHEARRGVCLCGVFTEIKRVWTSVDTSLFLWRYDSVDDAPVEYTGEDQAICAVGLVRPPSGVFIQAVQYVLVVATSVDIALVGLCGNGSLADPLRSIAFFSLPMYSVPSDGVMITSVATTKHGRVFLGGQDGHLYELKYSGTDTWMSKRCTKICHTAGIREMLPSFFRHAQPAIAGLVLDGARGVLYARTEEGGLQVFDIGANCDLSPRKVDESPNVAAAADKSFGSRLITSSEASRDRRNVATLIDIYVVDVAESTRIQVVAVLSDGRRIYFSTQRRALRPSLGMGVGAGALVAERPHKLEMMYVRPGPPMSEQGDQRTAAPASPLQVEAACLTGGIVLLSEAGDADIHARLVMTAVDNTLPPNLMGYQSVPAHGPSPAQMRGLREVVARERLNGRAETIVEITRTVSSLSSSDTTGDNMTSSSVHPNELASQILPQRRFLVVGTAGTAEVVKSRPVDILGSILEQDSGDALFDFFRSYGSAESASICMQLIADPPKGTSAFAIDAAGRALQDTQLVGEPCLEDTYGYESGGGQPGFMNMGRALREPKFLFSGAHEGILRYITRILLPIWEKSIGTVGSNIDSHRACASVDKGATIRPTVRPDTLRQLETLLTSISAFLENKRKSSTARHARGRGGVSMLKQTTVAVRDVIPVGSQGKRRRVEEAIAEEERSFDGIIAVVHRSREAVLLLRHLSDSANFGRITLNLSKEMRRRLVSDMSFRKFIATAEGETVASELVAALMDSADGLLSELSSTLRRGCPSFFKEDDMKYYSAASLLNLSRLEDVSETERRRRSSEALAQLLEVPSSCDLEKVVPRFAELHFYEGVILLPLKRAHERDPRNEALRTDIDPAVRARAEEERYQCYEHVTKCLEDLRPGANVAATGDVEVASYRNTLVALAFQTDDELFHYCFYDAMIKCGLERELTSLRPRFLDAYLRRRGGGIDGRLPRPLNAEQVRALELLAHVHQENGQYDAAVGVYSALGQRPSGFESDEKVSLDERERHFQAGLLVAKNAETNLQHLDVHLQLLDFQRRIRRELRRRILETTEDGGATAGVDSTAMQKAVDDLEFDLTDITTLYNDYASEFGLWDLSLEIIQFSIPGNEASGAQLEETSRQLWDQVLVDASSFKHGGSALRAAAAEVSRIGSRLYPFDASFPAHHVARRLEEIAYGLWPKSMNAGTREDASDTIISSRIISESLLDAARMDFACVYRAYEALISLRGVGGGGETGVLHQPRLRYRMLRTSFEVLAAWARQVEQSSSERSESAGIIIFACETCLAEVKRLQIPALQADELAAQYRSLRDEMNANLPLGRGLHVRFAS